MKWLIFLFFAGIYILTIGTPFYSIDAQTMYDTSRALAFEQTIAFPEDFYSPQLKSGKDGRLYSQYDPGLPLIAAPVVWLSDTLAKSQLWNRYAFSAYMVEWIPAVFAAAGLCGLYALAAQLYSPRKALLIVLAAGLCTPLWPYARMFFPEGTLAGLLMLAFWAGWQGRVWGASLVLGLMILIRAPMVIYVLSVLWLVWKIPSPPPFSHRVVGAGTSKRSERCLPEKGRESLTYRPPLSHMRRGVLVSGSLLFFPFLAGVALLYHNYLRYGEMFTSGYGYSGQEFNTPLWVGVYGLLLSPGKGVFWYTPILLLAVWKFPAFYRKNPVLAQAILMATAGVLLLYGRWWAWHGGWCWGPRFLVPILPLWMLPLGEIKSLSLDGRGGQEDECRGGDEGGTPDSRPVYPHPKPLSHWARGLPGQASLPKVACSCPYGPPLNLEGGGVKLLLLLSFLIALLGVITNVNYTYESHPEDVVHYTFAPIVGAIKIVLDTRTEYLSTFYLYRIGMAQHTAILVPAVLLLCVTGSGYLAAKMVDHEQ